MAETKGDTVKKLAALVKQRGGHVTDQVAREAFAREYNDYVTEAFDSSTPAPEISREKMDQLAEDLMSSR